MLGSARQELDTHNSGMLHDEIEKRQWAVVDTPPTKERDRTKKLPDGDLTLCTPKLDAVLKWFGMELPDAALIFETQRSITSDPRLAGTVLQKRLNDRRVQDVHRFAFLKNEDRLEDPSHQQDSVIKRSIVTMLTGQIVQRLEVVKPKRVVLATIGGLPAANEVIQELARLHAVDREVVALEVPDGAFAKQDDRAIPEKFHPAAGYRARWHALSLIEKGNLLGAWGAVSHLEGAPHQEWTQVIQWLAHFASSLPLPAGCDLAVLSNQRMAVRAALRVELALRAGDIPRAVHGTVAFFEAALWDKLGERLERSSDPKKRRFFKIVNGAALTADKLLRLGSGNDDDRKRPFELRETIDDVAWYWVYDGGGGPAARLAKYFLQSDALEKFEVELDRIRDLRNDVAHNEPTPELMNDARARMQTAELWSQADTFLSQALVQAVLKELGESEPDTLLERLLSDVRRRLTDPSYPDELAVP